MPEQLSLCNPGCWAQGTPGQGPCCVWEGPEAFHSQWEDGKVWLEVRGHLVTHAPTPCGVSSRMNLGESPPLSSARSWGRVWKGQARG